MAETYSKYRLLGQPQDRPPKVDCKAQAYRYSLHAATDALFINTILHLYFLSSHSHCHLRPVIHYYTTNNSQFFTIMAPLPLSVVREVVAMLKDASLENRTFQFGPRIVNKPSIEPGSWVYSSPLLGAHIIQPWKPLDTDEAPTIAKPYDGDGEHYAPLVIHCHAAINKAHNGYEYKTTRHYDYSLAIFDPVKFLDFLRTQGLAGYSVLIWNAYKAASTHRLDLTEVPIRTGISNVEMLDH